ncbi:hypothetical protein BGZ73_004447 [Actinomortierella ambigua]|nr:hypothetical protein BGZ73_004447 [Actinomortierella ambigua]
MAISFDRENQLGRCFNAISNKICTQRSIDSSTVEFEELNQVNIKLNYYSSSEEYKKSREIDVDGGINTPFGGLHAKYGNQAEESKHQNTSYYVYYCEVFDYAVCGQAKKTWTIGKDMTIAERYINNVTYGGYLRIIAKITEKQANTQQSKVADLGFKFQDISLSFSAFTGFLHTESSSQQNTTARYELSIEQSSGDAPAIKMDLSNIEDVISSFVKNVRGNRDRSVVMRRSFSLGSVDPSAIRINKKNYTFLSGNYSQIETSRLPNTTPMLSEMEKLLKMLEHVDIVNQSQFDYHYAKICDHHPELSSRLFNFQFYDYETKYKKIKEMPLHLLLLKVLDSVKYNANPADKEKIKTTLIQLERLCSKHNFGEADLLFSERVYKYVDYADEKLKYAHHQIGDGRKYIISDHIYDKDSNMENAFLRDNDLIHSTFYSRHKIIRFLSNFRNLDAKAVRTSWFWRVLDDIADVLAIAYALYLEILDMWFRTLFISVEFFEVSNNYYDNNLERCRFLADDEYKEVSEYNEDNIANVTNYDVFKDRAKRFQNACDFFESVKLIKRLRDIEINRFVIAVIGNTKVGKSSFLARLGLKSNARAGVHTTCITPHILGGVMFLDFPGNDDTDDVIRNEFLQNYRTVDMCIVVSEINKASTDGVFSLIDKLRIANDIPYMIFLNQCDRVIDDGEGDEDLPIDDFNKIVNEKAAKVKTQFLHNGIKNLKIYPTTFHRRARDLREYGVIGVRDIMFIVKQLLDKEKVHYDVSGLFEHIGGYREE